MEEKENRYEVLNKGWDGEVYARAYCSVAGTNLRIRSQNWRKLKEEDRR